jgi:serine/threonine-protein phosphatase 2A regulatory subunit B''
LDPLQSNKIFIKNILVSPILAELYDLRNDKLTSDELLNNWFSIENVKRLKEHFDKLDNN